MDTKFSGSANYVASRDLMETVNIAVALQKPLLIKGEPGTGKTMLAQAVADALGKKLIIWNVKSTTKAQDGLYVYDVVQRLYDSQFGNAGVDDVKKYIKLGKLGEAFSAEEQVVLLIDEIDKADLEFPNDLLWELDRMEFYIPETKETVQARQRSIVIITSNAEKELPDAFLRRCVFHYIEFPEQEQMEAILRVHFGDLEEKLVKQSLAAFYWLRELRGIEIVSFGVSSIKASEEDEKMLKDMQRTAVFSNPNMAAAYDVMARGDAMKAAASNTAGAATGFMGMGMAQNMGGGTNAAQLFQMGQQQAAKPAAAPASAPAPAAESWKCSCGATATGKFCTECGAKRPEAPVGWTCSCGTVNQGKFCTECGAKKPSAAPQYRCDKCGWMPADPKNPPKFCPECGDPFGGEHIVG